MDAERAQGQLRIEDGVAYLIYAYEVGQAIDLDEAERSIASSTERATLHKHPAPGYLEYRPAPLRMHSTAEPITIDGYTTAPRVDTVMFDFGARSVTYAIPLHGPLADLVALSVALSNDASLLADSRDRIANLVAVIGPALTRAKIAAVTEVYAIFHVRELQDGPVADELLAAHAGVLAQILRAEREPLSAQEVGDAVACHLAYGRTDLTLIDGDVALIFGPDGDDVRTVLEFANTELLEMRYLDQQLDAALDEAYRALSRQAWRHLLRPGAARADLQHIAQMQVDAALLFEAVNNALKLLSDQFVARVYRLSAMRFHLADWDASILRKLETLEGIYEKFSGMAANRRMEVLEWIIILLIAGEIVISIVR